MEQDRAETNSTPPFDHIDRCHRRKTKPTCSVKHKPAMIEASKVTLACMLIFILWPILGSDCLKASYTNEADSRSHPPTNTKQQAQLFSPQGDASQAAPTKRALNERFHPRLRPRSAGSEESSHSLRSLLMGPINELKLSGSKSEPPSRPPVDWSKQRPYFGNDMVSNVSVELGRKATLVCKVFELGDKTVSWLRPRENQILTVGQFTYVGDPRFSSINDGKSNEWILEIKDVGVNDSTSYECQVNTDPKMSFIINLNVKAAKAKIRQGEVNYATVGSNVEFTCDIGGSRTASSQLLQSPSSSASRQTYWYYNGNLLNYAQTQQPLERNFTIERDPNSLTSRFRLYNIQINDSGNYTCKPTSAEPATIQLSVKKSNRNGSRTGQHSNNNGHSKESQRTLRRNNELSGSGVEFLSTNAAMSLLSVSPVSLSTLSSWILLNWIIFHANIQP